LRQGADAASKIAGQDLPAITAFSEEQSPEVKDKVFEDFNSLAVVYRTPASSFIKVRCRLSAQEYSSPWLRRPKQRRGRPSAVAVSLVHAALKASP